MIVNVIFMPFSVRVVNISPSFGAISTMFLNSFQPVAASYLSFEPYGTFRVAFAALEKHSESIVIGVFHPAVTEVSMLQFLKAFVPMDVTFLGIEREESFSQ